MIANYTAPELTPYALDVLKLLSVLDIENGTYIRKGAVHDGGYVMVDTGLSNTVAYSLGISNDVSWDDDMAALGTHLYQYDHTITALPHEDPHFHWSKIGISAIPSDDPNFKSLPELITLNGHSTRRDMILKTDIESAEWDMLLEMDDETLGRFSQIVGEFHGFLYIDKAPQREKIIAVLNKLNRHHQLVHVHVNNYSRQGFMGGVAMADDLELTYVRRSDHRFVPSTRSFPTSLDNPNNRHLADFYLGKL
jgi:hypothetical protein